MVLSDVYSRWCRPLSRDFRGCVYFESRKVLYFPVAVGFLFLTTEGGPGVRVLDIEQRVYRKTGTGTVQG